MPKIRFNVTIDLGISHGDDNFIMYRQADPVEALKSKEDAKFTKKLISMWTRFATRGNAFVYTKTYHIVTVFCKSFIIVNILIIFIY